MYRIINKKKMLVTMAADAFGYALTWLPRKLARSEPVDLAEVRSILVIRTAYIGDVVMTLPLLAPLKQLYPKASLTMLTSRGAAPLLETNPFVDRVLTYDPFWFYATSKKDYWPFLRSLRQERFDLIIEARADIRDILLLARPTPAKYRVSYDVAGGGFALTHVVPHPCVKHRVPYHHDIARFLGAEVDDEQPEWGLYFTPQEQAEAIATLQGHGVEGPFLAAHPGARGPLRVWPEERYARTYDMLREHTGLPLVLLGAQAEKQQIQGIMGKMSTEAVDLSGQLRLRQTAAVLERAKLLLCNNSAPMHLGACLGVPLVVLSGSSKPDTYPWSPRSIIVSKHFSCLKTCDENTCTNAEYKACLNAVTPEDLFQGARRLLEDIDTNAPAKIAKELLGCLQ